MVQVSEGDGTVKQLAIPTPTFARSQAIDSIVRYLRMLRGWSETKLALAGNGFGTVDVDGRTNFVYVRVKDEDDDIQEARNATLLVLTDGDPILLAKERPGGLGGWLVVDWFGQTAPAPVICSDLACVGFVEIHAFVSGAGANHGGQSVAMRGHYAYCAIPSDIGTGWIPLTNARLVTVDLTTLTIVDDQDLGVELHWCNIRAARNSNKLFLIGGLGSSPLHGGQNVYRFDVSTPDAPSLDASATTDMYVGFWRLYESGTDVYLLGWKYATDIDPPNEGAYPIAVDGDTLATIGERADLYLGMNYSGSYSIVCGDTWVIPLVDLDDAHILYPVVLAGLDLTDPATLSTVWTVTHDNTIAPITSLNANTFYAYEHDEIGPPSPSLHWLYNEDGSKSQIPNAPGGSVGQGYSVGVRTIDGVTYHVGFVGGGSTNARAEVYNITSDAVMLLAQIACDQYTHNTSVKQEEADCDKDFTTVYLCSIGYCQSGCNLGRQSIVLNVMTVTG